MFESLLATCCLEPPWEGLGRSGSLAGFPESSGRAPTGTLADATLSNLLALFDIVNLTVILRFTLPAIPSVLLAFPGLLNVTPWRLSPTIASCCFFEGRLTLPDRVHEDEILT